MNSPSETLRANIRNYVKMSPWGERTGYFDVAQNLLSTWARLDRSLDEHIGWHKCRYEPCLTLINIGNGIAYCKEQVSIVREMFEEDLKLGRLTLAAPVLEDKE